MSGGRTSSGDQPKSVSAAGPHKVDIIRAACCRGLIDTLITDDVTAELLLAETP